MASDKKYESNIGSRTKIAGSIPYEEYKKLDLSDKTLRAISSSEEVNDWDRLADILAIRLCKRFIAPIDCLLQQDYELFLSGNKPTFGFAVLALDCILIETIEGIRQGKFTANDKEKDLLYQDFLRRAIASLTSNEKIKKIVCAKEFLFPFDIRFESDSKYKSQEDYYNGINFMSEINAGAQSDLANNFYKKVRCKLVHSGLTESDVKITGALTDSLYKDGKLNRTKFHCWLVKPEFQRLIRDIKGKSAESEAKVGEMEKLRKNVKDYFNHLAK